MAKIVKLSKVVAEMDVPNDEWAVYLNPRTGEMVTVTPEDKQLLNDPSTFGDAPDWQLEQLPGIRQAVESDEFLVLPDKFEIHEWSIMDRFVRSIDDDTQREILDRAIHRRGAFGRFRDALCDLGRRDEWHRFRNRAFEEIAITWLEDNKVPFERDRDSPITGEE